MSSANSVISGYDAVLAVDVMKTFMPGGQLPVAEGDQIVEQAKLRLLQFHPNRRFSCTDVHLPGSLHTADSYTHLDDYTLLPHDDTVGWNDERVFLEPHALFTIRQLQDYLLQAGPQVLWPMHGQYGTPQANIHPDIAAIPRAFHLVKGLDPLCDSYSAFRDNLGRPTGLHLVMHRAGIKRLLLVGLAFDYCVGFTAKDAVGYGFQVGIDLTATRSVAPDSEAEMVLTLAGLKVNLIG